MEFNIVMVTSLVALIAGILILVAPCLNYVVAIT